MWLFWENRTFHLFQAHPRFPASVIDPHTLIWGKSVFPAKFLLFYLEYQNPLKSVDFQPWILSQCCPEWEQPQFALRVTEAEIFSGEDQFGFVLNPTQGKAAPAWEHPHPPRSLLSKLDPNPVCHRLGIGHFWKASIWFVFSLLWEE